jgi:hypothetical protein
MRREQQQMAMQQKGMQAKRQVSFRPTTAQWQHA